jgi:hypothetical protein
MPAGIAPELVSSQAAAKAGGQAGKRQRGQASTAKALNAVQQSTASLGKFDGKRKGEPERAVKGQRQKRRSSTSNWASEKSNSLDIFNSIITRKGHASKQAQEDLANPNKKQKTLKKITKGRASQK